MPTTRDDSRERAATSGLPWWAGVLLALVLAVVGGVLDLRLGTGAVLDTRFHIGYGVGCVAAVCLVRPRALFTAMAQPPLVLIATTAGLVLATGTAHSTSSAALAIGTPLLNGFPTMAITTGIVLVIGALRAVFYFRARSNSRRRMELAA